MAGLFKKADGTFGHVWLRMTEDGSASVADFGTTPSSYFGLVTTANAPTTGVATYAIATGSKNLEYKSLSSASAEYCLLGFGTSVADAETNRDSGQVIIKAGEIGSERMPSNATHYSIKSASGTPVVQLAQKA